MYDVIRRSDFVNPTDYDKCKERVFNEIDNCYLYEGSEEECFIVDIPEDDYTPSPHLDIAFDVEDIFSDFEWKEGV